MTFLKQNWFRIIIVVIALILGLFYFVVVIPSRELDTNIARCRNLGEDYRKNEIKDNQSITFFVPKYTFSVNLDTCIYSGGFIDGKSLNKYIIDLNTNMAIENSYYFDNKPFNGLTTEEFDKKEKELFK